MAASKALSLDSTERFLPTPNANIAMRLVPKKITLTILPTLYSRIMNARRIFVLHFSASQLGVY